MNDKKTAATGDVELKYDVSTAHRQGDTDAGQSRAAEPARQDSPGVDQDEQAPAPAPAEAPRSTSKKLKVGDKYVVNYPRKAPVTTATIKVLTSEPGRHVGVEFDRPLGEYADNGNCYGKCKADCGLWVHPSHLLTEDEYKAMLAKGEISRPQSLEVDQLEFDSETGQVRPV